MFQHCNSSDSLGHLWKQRKWMRLTILAGFVGPSMVASSLIASTVTITDFETPTQANPPGYGGLVPTGFILTSSNGQGSVGGLQDIPNTPESGSQFFVFNDDTGSTGTLTNDPSDSTLNSLLGNYTAGATYTFSFYVAKTGNPIGTYFFHVLDGSSVLTPTSTSLNYRNTSPICNIFDGQPG
jgi:hypothetical protein